MVTFDWAGIPVLAKVTRCKSGTISRRDLNNGYAPKIKQPDTPDANSCVDAYGHRRQASSHIQSQVSLAARVLAWSATSVTAVLSHHIPRNGGPMANNRRLTWP